MQKYYKEPQTDILDNFEESEEIANLGYVGQQIRKRKDNVLYFNVSVLDNEFGQYALSFWQNLTISGQIEEITQTEFDSILI
jgi:hypothetical protein